VKFTPDSNTYCANGTKRSNLYDCEDAVNCCAIACAFDVEIDNDPDAC
jgi:hypothetical protein